MSAMVWLRMWLAGCGSWVVVGDAVSGRSRSGDVCTRAARRSSRRAHSLSTRETSTSSVGIFSLVFGFGAWLEAEVGRCLSISLRIMCRGLQMDLEVIGAFGLPLAQAEPVGRALCRARACESKRTVPPHGDRYSECHSECLTVAPALLWNSFGSLRSVYKNKVDRFLLHADRHSSPHSSLPLQIAWKGVGE